MYIEYRQQSPTSNDGFTLIEVLLAVFIASLVLVVLYGSFFQILKAKEKIEQELEVYHEARVIFSKMTKDLVTAFPRGALNSNSAISSDYFQGTREAEQSALRFTSLSRLPQGDTKESDQTEITYFVQPINENDSDLFALIRRDNPTFGAEEGGLEFPISERIVEFNVSYLNQPPSSNPEPVFEWDSNEASAFPNAVNINLILRGARGNDIEFNTLVLIPIAN